MTTSRPGTRSVPTLSETVAGLAVRVSVAAVSMLLAPAATASSVADLALHGPAAVRSLVHRSRPDPVPWRWDRGSGRRLIYRVAVPAYLVSFPVAVVVWSVRRTYAATTRLFSAR